MSSFLFQVQDVGAEKDAITSLRAPTHFGRPNWDRAFSSLTDRHRGSDVGVFFCGPPAISKTLHTKCNEYSTPNGTRFFFGKGAFSFFWMIHSTRFPLYPSVFRLAARVSGLDRFATFLWDVVNATGCECECMDADFFCHRKLLNLGH